MATSKAQRKKFLTVKLDEDYSVTADQYCFTLQKRRVNKKGVTLKTPFVIGYYPTLERLLVAFTRDKIRGATGAETVKELLSAIREVEAVAEDAKLKMINYKQWGVV